jgi:hypothetical protein
MAKGDGVDGKGLWGRAHHVEEVLHVQQLVPEWLGVGDQAMEFSMA